MRTLLCLTALLFACGTQPSEAGSPGEGPALHGERPAQAKALPTFRAVAQDGSARTQANLVGQPTVLWFYPAAKTPG